MIFNRLIYRRLQIVTYLCKCHCHHAASVNAVRVRFAPSPTGQLHLGGLRTALYNYLFARSNNGKFILRVEDTDQTRLVPGAMDKMVDMLQWTGIEIDEGSGKDGQYGPYIQSERLNLYGDMSEKLLQNGTAYRCFCTPRRLEIIRKEAIRQGETPKYDNKCRHLSEKEIEDKLSANAPYTIRFKLEHYTEPWDDLVYGPIVSDVASLEGDPVIIKTDKFPTYHFANVVDDHFMEISHVLRGVEWQVSTTKHILMYKAFGWNPPKYAHLPLLLNKDGKKLSKRQSDIHVEHFKNEGYFADTILNLLTDVGSGFRVRDTSGMTLTDLVNHFDLSLMNTNSTRIDMDKLSYFNKLQLKRRISDPCLRQELIQQLMDKVAEFYKEKLEDNPLKTTTLNETYIETVLLWAKNRIHNLDDLLEQDFQYLWIPPKLDDIVKLLPKDNPNGAISILNAVKTGLECDKSDFDEDELKTKLKTLSSAQGLKFGKSMKILRTAISGLEQGPGVAEMILTLGRENTLNRLQYAINKLQKS